MQLVADRHPPEAVPAEYESVEAFGVMMMESISVTLSADAMAIAPDAIAGALPVWRPLAPLFPNEAVT